MAIPQANSKLWSDIISGTKQVKFEFLAAKIFMSSAQLKLRRDPGLLNKLATELYELYEKNQKLPMVQKDLTNFG